MPQELPDPRCGRHPASAGAILLIIAIALGVLVAIGPAVFLWALGDQLE